MKRSRRLCSILNTWSTRKRAVSFNLLNSFFLALDINILDLWDFFVSARLFWITVQRTWILLHWTIWCDGTDTTLWPFSLFYFTQKYEKRQFILLHYLFKTFFITIAIKEELKTFTASLIMTVHVFGWKRFQNRVFWIIK